jgi:hypothetical protein
MIEEPSSSSPERDTAERGELEPPGREGKDGNEEEYAGNEGGLSIGVTVEIENP